MSACCSSQCRISESIGFASCGHLRLRDDYVSGSNNSDIAAGDVSARIVVKI